MDYLFGLLTGAAFFVCGLTAYLIGRKANTQPVKPQKPDDEVVRKQQQLHKGFEALMSYDVKTALQRKKVNHE